MRHRAPTSDDPAGALAPERPGPTQEGAIVFVGIDWSSQQHAVCVVDAAATKVVAFSVDHSADGLAQLVARLGRLGEPAQLPVAIERPDGRLVDRLLEAGHPVVPVQPHALKAWRKAQGLAGAKTDPGDAALLADYLRLCQARLRLLTPFSAHTKALRAVVRTRDDLVSQRVAAGNQLRACLEAFWPGAAVIFADITSQIALAFLIRYPTPESAARLGTQRLTGFLVKHGYCGRRPAGQLLDRLRAAPAGLVGTVEVEARRDSVLALVGILGALNTAIRDLDRSIIAHLAEHPDATVFTSLPRSGQINAAQILAEWGDCRAAYPTPDAVACLAGVVPVTRRSGKHTSVSYRWAANKRLRRAVCTFADNSRHASPWAAHLYAAARARGLDHPHAIRVLARAWIRVIWRCWHDGVAYDPTRHGNAKRLSETTESAA
jgi:transposase